MKFVMCTISAVLMLCAVACAYTGGVLNGEDVAENIMTELAVVLGIASVVVAALA